MRMSDVKRSFGNKASWDRPFDEWFRVFVDEANQAVFDNGRVNRALNCDALEAPGSYDLVYIDTPYLSRNGIGVDYFGFYHFLEGLTMYDGWFREMDLSSKHRRLKPKPNAWIDKRQIHTAFDQLFNKYRDSILVISYRSDGIPSEAELRSLLKQYKAHVQVSHYGQYKYALSKNGESKEILLVGA